MRKHLTIVAFFAVAFFLVPSTWAGGIDNKTNWSIEYVRSLNRNASTDAADIVAYNPAGVIKMDEGLYGNLSVHAADKAYSNTIDGDKSEATGPSYIPGLFALYKQKKWAAMFAFSNYGGGGLVEYDDGTWRTQQAGFGIIGAANAQIDAAEAGGMLPPGVTAALLYYSDITNQSLEAESMYLGYTLGGAYQINDIFSVSLGARYIAAKRGVSGSVTVSAADSILGTQPGLTDDQTVDLEYDEEAAGWGGILGVNISPTEELNIGVRYETETTLDFEYSVDEGDALLSAMGIEDGESANRNLPAIFALGVSYQVTQQMRVETNLTYYLHANADWEGAEDDVDNGYDLAIGLMYYFSDTLEASVGFMYTDPGIDVEDMSPEAPELNAKTIGTGVAWSPVSDLVLNFGVGNSFYDTESFTDSETGTEVEYKKNNLFIGFGVQYKFL